MIIYISVCVLVVQFPNFVSNIWNGFIGCGVLCAWGYAHLLMILSKSNNTISSCTTPQHSYTWTGLRLASWGFKAGPIHLNISMTSCFPSSRTPLSLSSRRRCICFTIGLTVIILEPKSLQFQGKTVSEKTWSLLIWYMCNTNNEPL